MPGRRPDRTGPVSSVTPWRTRTSVVNGGAFAGAWSDGASAAPPAGSGRAIAGDRNGRPYASRLQPLPFWRSFSGDTAEKERRLRGGQPEKRRSSAATGQD